MLFRQPVAGSLFGAGPGIPSLESPAVGQTHSMRGSRYYFAKYDECACRAGLSQRMTRRDGWWRVSRRVSRTRQMLPRLSSRNCLTGSVCVMRVLCCRVLMRDV